MIPATASIAPSRDLHYLQYMTEPGMGNCQVEYSGGIVDSCSCRLSNNADEVMFRGAIGLDLILPVANSSKSANMAEQDG